MKDKGKALGLIGVIVTSIASTLLGNWVQEREIKKQVEIAMKDCQSPKESQ